MAALEKGGRMAEAEVVERLAVVEADPKGGEPTGFFGIEEEELVSFVHDLAEIGGFGGEGAERTAQAKGVKASGDPFSSDVGDGEKDFARWKGQDVVKIAADFSRGDIAGSDVDMVKRGKSFWQEALLDIVAELEFEGEFFSVEALRFGFLLIAEERVHRLIELLADSVDLKSPRLRNKAAMRSAF